MKTLKLITLLFVFTLFATSCNSDDNLEEKKEEKVECENRVSLENTTWIGNGDRNGEKIIFTSNKNYTWEADYGNHDGEYCYDGTDGKFKSSIRFVIVNGNEIVLNSENQGGTGTFNKQ